MIAELVKFVFSLPFLVSLVVASVTTLYYYRIWKLKKVMPPGPCPLPILGNIMALRGCRTMQERMWELSKVYGDPFTFWFGTMRTIVCNKKDTIREVLINKQNIYCSRQDSAIFNLMNEGSMDIALGKYGPVWRVHRKLASRSIRLKNLILMVYYPPSGLSRTVIGKGLEEQVEKSVMQAVDFLKTQKGPVKLSNYLANIVFNVICHFAYGQHYPVDDPVFLRLNYLNAKGNEQFMKAAIFEVLPFNQYMPLRHIPIVKEVCTYFQEFIDYVKARIDEHRETYEDGVIRDFVDAMIAEQIELKTEGEKDVEFLNDMHLVMVVLDFFNAGTDTTQAVLTWLFLFLTINEEMQEKCYQEIRNAVGDREIQLSDRGQFPFLEACIWETLRMRMPVPMGIPHVSIEDDKIGSYLIPANTAAFTNLYAMHMDPEGDFSKNVDQFDPATHFMRDGELDKEQGHQILPFGGGRRVCLGEQLARNDLFLIAGRLIQQLKFSKVPGDTYTTDHDPSIDLVFYAQPYNVIVEER